MLVNCNDNSKSYWCEVFDIAFVFFQMKGNSIIMQVESWVLPTNYLVIKIIYIYDKIKYFGHDWEI